MLWVKAFHIISMVCWFSGLFYLPRLFVYHAMAEDSLSKERFKIMEKKLYFYIINPASVLTIIFGGWLLSSNFHGYMQAGWMHLKLTLVLLLIGYQHYLGNQRRAFAQDRQKHGHRFYRILNEIPVLFLIAIVILAVVKP